MNLEQLTRALLESSMLFFNADSGGYELEVRCRRTQRHITRRDIDTDSARGVFDTRSLEVLET